MEPGKPAGKGSISHERTISRGPAHSVGILGRGGGRAGRIAGLLGLVYAVNAEQSAVILLPMVGIQFVSLWEI